MADGTIFQLINQPNKLDSLKDIYGYSLLDIDTPNEKGQTPLHVAVLKNNLEVAAYLLSKGANPNAKDSMGLSPYIAAAANGLSEMFDLISQYNPDVTQVNRFGGTALLPSSEKGFIRVVELALKNKVPVDHVNKLGWSALLEAVVLGDEGFLYQDIVVALLNENADTSIKDFDGKTVMDYALEQGKDRILSLLKQGEDKASPFSVIRQLLKKEEYLNAIKQLLAMDDSLEQVYYLGYCYEQLGKLKTSQFYYKQGLKHSVDFAYYIANSYKKEKNYQEVLAYFDLGINESKNPEFFKYHKSNFLREIGEHQVAINIMDELLFLDPLRVDYLFHKSNSLISLGKLDDAYEVMRVARDIQPNNSLFEDQMQQLEELIIKEV
ncbi:hypothetical protein BW731_02865 [Vagococcus martis]|uniref:Ankyrin repeat protein n=1 Tax=Vagococcus martis TaxID=1768210 RepID=A0A1V4DFF8_9ENTE|nr:ankyrin repeat domain-containing protein [Vagococcus martis]OPF87228.1 hypothetical protein BW731_02865 [Vagococcus martis]